MNNSEFQLVSARVGNYIISGEINVSYNYETETETVDTHCGTKVEQTDVDLFDVMMDGSGIFWLEIEEYGSPETWIRVTGDDEPDVTARWVELLNSQSDEWWTTEITNVNDVWQQID